MGWGAAAGSALIAGSSLLGGKNKVKAPDPYQQTDAMIRANNPNTNTNWGNTRLVFTPGPDNNSWTDDSYAVNTNLSPAMQALADKLVASAGASRGTFSSGGMPEALQDRYAATLYRQANEAPREFGEPAQGNQQSVADLLKSGVDLSSYRPQMSSFDRPQYGFGADNGPVQMPEPPDTSKMTNREAFELVKNTGNLSRGDLDWLSQLFNGQDSRLESAQSMVNGSWDPGTSGLNDVNKGIVARFMAAIPKQDRAPAQDVYAGGSPTFDESAGSYTLGQPDPARYDTQAYQNLVNTLARRTV